MAGRGTDIPLGPGVAERGGLHVISCQHNSSRRIDRQLIGRCARKGDPGSAETLITLRRGGTRPILPGWIARAIGRNGAGRPAWLIALALRAPQWRIEREQRAQRRALLEQDTRLERELSIGGPME